MFELIQNGMAEKGYNYTSAQIENKWKALERSFKGFTDNKKKTGRGRKTIPFEK